MNTPNIIDVFKYVGNKASYHYADDSTKEWGTAREMQKIALKIFDACPEYQNEMRRVSKDFLWSLGVERPLEE